MVSTALMASQGSSTTIRNQQQNVNIQNLSQIVKSVRADISHLKAQLESLPPFPEGKCTLNHGSNEFQSIRVTAAVSSGPLPEQRRENR